MYGVLLAGGTGSRLWPLTEYANKHTLPVYDRPMIFHPLGNITAAGIQDIVVITGGEHYEQVRSLLDTLHDDEKNTRHLLNLSSEEKLNLRYALQDMPAGIADALARAHCIVKDNAVAVMLADNIFEQDTILQEAVKNFQKGAHIFLKEIPEDQLYEKGKDGKLRAKYGMARLSGNTVIDIMEKPSPEQLPSRYAVTGAYLYDADVFRIVPNLRPSQRGELEITDVNNAYIKQGTMTYTIVDGWWADAGESKEGLFQASTMVREKVLKRTV